MSITEKNGLKINTKLLDFVNNEIIPGTDIKSEEFWTSFGKIVHELAPINKKLIQNLEIFQICDAKLRFLEFVKRFHGDGTKIFVPSPTWGNHIRYNTFQVPA